MEKANPEHVEIVKSGAEAIAKWREENEVVKLELRAINLVGANLRGANLVGADLDDANLRGADLVEADLGGAFLREANLEHANLRGANLVKAELVGAFLRDAKLPNAKLRCAKLRDAELVGANLVEAKLEEADLTDANLAGAYLSGANFEGADLRGTMLEESTCVQTRFSGSDLRGCRIYGISAWDIQVDDDTIQTDLIITPMGASAVTVDNLKVAQFVYILLHNKEIREVIDTITSKVVLILGRFTEDRMRILEAIREELRHNNYVPVLFDFENPSGKTLTETITTLARMARFIIADITDAKSIPQELMAIVTQLPSVPVQPLLLAGEREYAMFESFRPYPWVLPEHEYENLDQLIKNIPDKVFGPAEQKAKALRGE